ncbi:MAG: hypothetical protein EXR50_07095 [Dehalococcoidia bacterium]|nr:hypothetical protein [Dehalococcoidia bacterium]
MWTELIKAPNLMVAELWKQFFDIEGVTAMIVPDSLDWEGVSDDMPRRILVPLSKKHVAEEVLRKL